MSDENYMFLYMHGNFHANQWQEENILDVPKNLHVNYSFGFSFKYILTCKVYTNQTSFSLNKLFGCIEQLFGVLIHEGTLGSWNVLHFTNYGLFVIDP